PRSLFARHPSQTWVPTYVGPNSPGVPIAVKIRPKPLYWSVTSTSDENWTAPGVTRSALTGPTPATRSRVRAGRANFAHFIRPSPADKKVSVGSHGARRRCGLGQGAAG